MASEQHDCGITGCTSLHEVGSMEDAQGHEIEFFTSGDEVHVDFEDSYLVLDAETRETFQRLFMEAERLAEAGGAVSGRG